MAVRGVEEMLAEARRDLDRVAPADLAAEVESGALIVDIRSPDDRRREGDLPGAVVIDPNAVHWRLDPDCPHRIPEADDHDRRIVVVCNQGYGSSLVAASLRQMGLARATDLDGGYQAWKAATDGSGAEARSRHWESTYRTRSTEQVSWFQPEARVSLDLVAEAGVPPEAPVVDVGGGASPFVDGLLTRGHGDLTVLDLSPTALDAARRRLGADADRVHWVTADVLAWRPERRYGLWHDRAVFHFFVDLPARAAYTAVLRSGLAPGGTVIVGAFAPDGPASCSGLPVARYDADGLAEALGPGLEVVAHRRHDHHTPSGTTQPFTWTVLRATT